MPPVLKYSREVFYIMRFKNYIVLKLRADEKQLARCLEKIKGLEGYTLYSGIDKGKVRYRYRTETLPEPVYIGWRKDGPLLRRLLEKENAERNIKKLKDNISLLKKLLTSYHFTEELYSTEKNFKFRKSENRYKKEHLQHDTGLGFLTRTKSEAIVAGRLFRFGFVFQYEQGLRIYSADGKYKTVYPDFTIFLPEGRIIYLEHVGKLNDAEYKENFFTKINDYYVNDLLLGRDVFITMDSPDGSIDIKAIDELLQMLCLI